MRWAALLLLIGCGKVPQWPGEPALYGAYLDVDSTADAYARQENYRAYLRAIIRATADHFGHRPEDVAGVRIWVSGRLSCAGAGEFTTGCFTSSDRTIQYLTGTLGNGTCADAVLLPHEMLHLYLGDPNHTSPLWADLPALTAQLEELSVCHF